MKKTDRQMKIRELIASHQVERQGDLVRLLQDDGIDVTQATVSRDIKEMQLIKVPSAQGGYHYSVPVKHDEDKEQQLKDTINHDLVSLKRSDRFISLHLAPGHGPVAAMLIKQIEFPEVFTAIGDDTSVLVVCESAEDAMNFEQLLVQYQQ